LARATALTIFQGRTGDRNELAIAGALSIGRALAQRLGQTPTIIGQPTPVPYTTWQAQLDAALPDLRALQGHVDSVLLAKDYCITAMPRCAPAMATLPMVAKHRPEACVIWLDSHADLNTPESSVSGYLGGLVLAAPLGLWRSGLGAGIGLDSLILVGQRDLDPFEQELITAQSITHLLPGPDLPHQLQAAIAGRPVYVHLDCDVMEAGIVPTDYMLAGGLLLDDLLACSTVIAKHEVIGLEIAEFQNSWGAGGDPVSPEPLLDALMPLFGVV
jgi:arginase